MPRPTGLTFDPARGELLVAQLRSGSSQILRLTLAEESRGSFSTSGPVRTRTLAFDPTRRRLEALRGGIRVSMSPRGGVVGSTDVRSLGLRAPVASTFDPSTGTWYVLDDAVDALVVVRRTGRASRIRLGQAATYGGVAFNPSDGLVYVSDLGRGVLFGLDRTGSVRTAFRLGGLGLRNPGAMTFAPSADRTDDPSIQHLFVAEAGDAFRLGGVTEISLASDVGAVAAAVEPNVTASLVQVINTAQWSPASPDPSGITFVPSTDHLLVADSEVDEQTGAGFHGVNLWRITRSGSVVDTGDLTEWTEEPTGVGYDPGTNTLFVSTDSGDRIYVMRPGGDARFGTADDVVTFINAGALGSGDTEDPEFDPASGHLFFVDGTSTEVYRINPVDGVFGNGNDVTTHFDVGQFGATDTEGLASDPARGTLLVGDRGQKRIYEVTKTGEFVRIISVGSIPGLRFVSGLTMAPASNGPGRNYWIVDRAIDNGANSSENDGKIFEVAVPTSGDPPPTVAITSPAEGATVSGTVQIQATASDAGGVTQVQFFVGSTSLGTDTNGADGWSMPWNTATGGNGPRTISATATDTIGQTGSDSNNVTVNNLDPPPTVTITSPAEGATVSGTIQIQATASDAGGITQVQFFVGSTSLGTDTNGADGWSIPWNTTTVGDGPRTISATATDTIGQTGSDSNNVTVDNVDTAPTVSIAAPPDGAVVTGTQTIQATATDDKGVTQVQFFDGATSLGTDTNGTNGWSVSWNTAAATEGSHTLFAIATDTIGQTGGDSNAVTVDRTGPTVAITAPSPGATVAGTVTVSANATDAVGVTSVQFFVGATSIGTDTVGADGWSVPWATAGAGNGIHTLTARATDTAGNPTTSPGVQVTVDNPSLVDVPIAASLDDVEERAIGSISTTSADLELLLDGTNAQRAVGLRFTGVNVPRGANVLTAYVQFQVDEVSSDTTNLTITGQASDNAPAFGTTTFNVTNRPRTAATVPWAPPSWPVVNARGPDQRTPNLEAVLDEILARPGWVAGNALVVIVTGSGRRIADAFEGSFAPVLHIEYGPGDDKPTVLITDPAEGATVSGTVTIHANASDDHGVTQVAFLDGSTPIGTDTNGADGWSIPWNTNGLSEGTHTLTATATDTIGQTTGDANSVTVDNVDGAPTVSISAPSAGASISGTTQIQANASDDHGVTQVEFFDGATSVGTDANGANGWSVSWDTGLAAEGSHSLTAVATDTAQQTTTSFAVIVTVDNTDPTAMVTSPASGATVVGTIAVQAVASDGSGVGVGSVMFLLDGSTLIGTDSNGADGWGVQWNSNLAVNGPHQITAVAADLAGNSGTSAPIAITIDNPLVLDIPIAVSGDDVEEKSNGNILPASSDLDMVLDNSGVQRGVGLRFLGVNVPAGATILDAYVQFQTDKASTAATNLTIQGEASNNAPAFVSGVKFNLTNRARTGASIAWVPPTWPTVGARGVAQRTPQLGSVLSEIFARPGWTPGNAVVLIFTGTGERVAEAFDGGFPPVLHIEYEVN